MSTKRFVAKHGLDNNNQTITNVANPINGSDVATKTITDSIFTFAQAAFDSANNVAPQIEPAFLKANSAFDAANTANTNAANASFLSTGTVPNERLSNIPNSSLANSSVTINGTAISLGSSGSIVAGATITDDISTNATRYVMLGTSTSGAYTVANTSSIKLNFNPNTGTLFANTIYGDALQAGPSIVLISENYTTSTTNQITLDSFSTSLYRTAIYEVQMTSSTNYHTITLKAIHDGTTVYLTQYGEIFTNTSLGSFDASIAAGILSLLFTPTNAVTEVKFIKQLIVV